MPRIIAKTAIIEEGLPSWRTVKKGPGFTFRHFFKTTAIFLVFSGLQLLALPIYWWVEGRSGMVTSGLILVFFVLQQGLVFVRVMAGISSIYYTTGQTVNPINSAPQT